MDEAGTLLDLWRSATTECPEGVCAICEGREYTYGEVDALSTALAGALQETAGLRADERVAFAVPNSIEFVIAYIAVMKAGCVAVPINVRLAAEEMEFILADAGAAAVFVHVSTRSSVESVLDRLPNIRAKISVGFAGPNWLSFDQLTKPQGAPTPAHPQPGDVISIIYTSGTTGRPRGAMITHANVVFNARSAELGLGFRSSDRHMLAVPLFHVTGLNTILPATILHRSSVVITASPSPVEQLKLVERFRVTTLLGVPTLYIMMAAVKDLDKMNLSSLRLIGYSGAPMPTEAILKLRERFPNVDLHNFYGLTETTSIASVLPAANAVSHAASIGRPVPRVEFMIADDNGNPLPRGETGELCIRGGNVFKGYLNQPEATRESFFGDWFQSGDLARVDADGFVFLQGRKKELIIVAGENVYPIEVENVLCQHPAVREAAVVGMPSGIFGELVHAVIVLKEGSTASEADIRKHCSERLASFKVPHKVDFIAALPRNPSGKVVKRLLQP